MVHMCSCETFYNETSENDQAQVLREASIIQGVTHFSKNLAFIVPGQKIEENGLVTKSSNLSEESLGRPNTQIQIHKYTNTQILLGQKLEKDMTCAIFLER